MTIHLSAPHRPLIDPTHLFGLALLVLGALLVVGLFLAPQPVGVASTSPAASSEAPVSQRLAPLVPTPPSDCAVTGDLAGNDNPAEIAATLCGGEKR